MCFDVDALRVRVLACHLRCPLVSCLVRAMRALVAHKVESEF